jgi:TFIIF-interacting CTD phosphatase-like protein
MKEAQPVPLLRYQSKQLPFSQYIDPGRTIGGKFQPTGTFYRDPLYMSPLDETQPLTDKWLVLDMDETLIHTFSEGDEQSLEESKIMTNPSFLPIRKRVYNVVLDDAPDKKGNDERLTVWGLKRPHLDEFLEFAFDYFQGVCVWSAGLAEYVRPVCDNLFQEIQSPALIYSQNKCQKHPEGFFEKPLELMIKDPIISPYMTLKNTFIIDDRATAYSHCNPNNGIQIPPYSPKSNELRMNDTYLLDLIRWFQTSKVINSQDVRNLDKSNIFTS